MNETSKGKTTKSLLVAGVMAALASMPAVSSAMEPSCSPLRCNSPIVELSVAADQAPEHHSDEETR